MNKSKSDDLMQQAIEGAEAIRNWDEHKIPLSKLCEKYSSNREKGLSTKMINTKLKEYGSNKIKRVARVPFYIVFFKSMFGIFNLQIYATAIICMAHQDLVIGCILLALGLLSGYLTYKRTKKSVAIERKFQSLAPKKA